MENKYLEVRVTNLENKMWYAEVAWVILIVLGIFSIIEKIYHWIVG